MLGDQRIYHKVTGSGVAERVVHVTLHKFVMRDQLEEWDIQIMKSQ